MPESHLILFNGLTLGAMLLFFAGAKAAEDSVLCAIPVDEMLKIIEKDYRAGFLFMKQIALLVSTRLVKMRHLLDITGPGYI